MSDVKNFFNSGVLLMDLRNMRKEPELKNLFINEARYRHKDRYYHDQDVFNFVLEGKTKLLPQKFNLNYFLYFPQHIKNVPLHIQEEFLTNLQKKDICILHYNGNPKPWESNVFDNWLSDLWWKYARLTPFYEKFVCLLCEKETQSLISNVSHLSQYKLRYWKYRIFANFMWGKKRQRYNQKKKEYKAKINEIKKILKD